MIEELFSKDNLLGNIIGLLAVVSALGIYVYKSRQKILFAKLIADGLWAIHFLLLGATTGGVLNVVNAFRDCVFYNKDSKRWARSKYWVWVFVVVGIISGIISWEGYFSLLPIIGSAISVIGLWCSDAYILRVVSFFAISLWIVYAAISSSALSFFYNVFALCSILSGFIRDLKEKRHKKTGV